jgi:hypothetical protein
VDDATAIRELLTWFLQTDDEAALRAGLADIAPHLWPAFSAEAAAELRDADEASRALHRRTLGDERRRREY